MLSSQDKAFLIILIILFIANRLRTLECLATPFTAVAAEKKPCFLSSKRSKIH